MNPPDAHATTTVAALIGHPVRHSLSPVLQNAAFRALGLDWVFVVFDVAPGDGAAAVAAMRTLGVGGLSVTMPHKEAAAAACDALTPDAAALRSANCITARADGSLLGDSTDGEGFRRALVDAGHDPAGRSVLVLGAGGAARAVALALGRVGCPVTVAARRPELAATAAALAPGGRWVAWDDRHDALASAELVVQATPVGMAGDPATPIDPDRLRTGQVVAELVYYPLSTPLLEAARARGIVGIDGLGMLVHQAALAFECWTGRSGPAEVMAAAAREALRAR